jgi:hypothetical protein
MLTGDSADDVMDNEIEFQRKRVMGLTRDMDRMKIAWRYQNLPTVSARLNPVQRMLINYPILDQTQSNVPYCCLFDITKQMDIQTHVDNGLIQTLNCTDLNELYDNIESLLKSGNFMKDQHVAGDRHVARIAINNFCSSLWNIQDTTVMHP